MKILIVEDIPEFKIERVIHFLRSKNLNFSYELVNSSSSALKNLFNHFNDYDLIILDLGLPFSDDGSDYNSLEGLFILEELLRKNIKMPLIINSTTEIPNEKELFEKYQQTCGIIEHIHELTGNYLFNFIKENIIK